MQAQSKIIIKSEISLDQLYNIICQLPLKQRLNLANKVKQDALQEKWQKLSAKLPDVPEITQEEILQEIEIVRKDRYRRRKKHESSN